MGDKCEQEKCAHYVSKDTFHVYRHKFIWTISIATVLAIICFACIVFSFRKSHNAIVEANADAIGRIESQLAPASLSRDSCYYANDQLEASMREYMASMKSLLELETTKIQSDYELLSLWAGILMIVFLVFSIYSMYKTDEILKQSKLGLEAVENAEKKADDEIKKVSKKADEETERIQLATTQTIEEVRKEINASKEEFQTMYKDMLAKMEQVKNDNTALILGLIQKVTDINAEQKGDAEENNDDK